MNTIEKLVITRYDEYDVLLKNKKVTKQTHFGLTNGTGPKKPWNLADLDLVHTNGMVGNLVTEQSKRKSSKYRLILFVKEFAIEPLCRFDSDGVAHENIEQFKPLITKKINTPHFHQYDNNGYNYAFKTPFLIEHEQEIKDSIQSGLTEMCTVYNIFTTSKSFPNIVDTFGGFVKENLEDLHKDIYFPL